jgi:hypothetical protein
MQGTRPRSNSHCLPITEQLLPLLKDVLGQVVDEEAHVGLSYRVRGRRGCCCRVGGRGSERRERLREVEDVKGLLGEEEVETSAECTRKTRRETSYQVRSQRKKREVVRRREEGRRREKDEES